MAKIQSPRKRIEPVEGFGVRAYRIDFSVDDLYTLNYLGHAVADRTPTTDCPEYKLAEFVGKLVANTIAHPERGWDCFGENESAE